MHTNILRLAWTGIYKIFSVQRSSPTQTLSTETNLPTLKKKLLTQKKNYRSSNYQIVKHQPKSNFSDTLFSKHIYPDFEIQFPLYFRSTFTHNDRTEMLVLKQTWLDCSSKGTIEKHLQSFCTQIVESFSKSSFLDPFCLWLKRENLRGTFDQPRLDTPKKKPQNYHFWHSLQMR